MNVEVVQRAKMSDPHALEEIYNETRQMVYFTALGIVHNEDDAEDVVQETYIKVFRNIARLQDEKAFISWLKMIVVNVSKNSLRKRKPVLFQNDEEGNAILESIEEVGEDFLPQEYVDQAEKREIIISMIENLSDAQRTAVMLYYFDELPLSEVSRIMETTDGTTKSRLNYARKQIRTQVDEQERQGNKLYVGVPMLTRILHLVSQNYDLPVETAKHILSNSLQAANIAAGTAASSTMAGSGTAGQAAVTGGSSAMLEGTTGTVAKTALAKGILAKITGVSAQTKLIALIAAGVLVVGSGTGAALAVKHHNDAVKAAIVLQQKQKEEARAKAKAASEAAEKKKAEEEAAAVAASSQQAEENQQQNPELVAQLCENVWNYEGNGVNDQQYAFFYPDGTCKFTEDAKAPEGDQTTAEAKIEHEEYDGTFQTIGNNDISVNLKYSRNQIADSSRDCSGTYTVGWDWNDPNMEEMVKDEAGPNVSPMTLTLKFGAMPFGAYDQIGDTYGFYKDGGDSIASPSASNSASSSSSQAASSGTNTINMNLLCLGGGEIWTTENAEYEEALTFDKNGTANYDCTHNSVEKEYGGTYQVQGTQMTVKLAESKYDQSLNKMVPVSGGETISAVYTIELKKGELTLTLKSGTPISKYQKIGQAVGYETYIVD